MQTSTTADHTDTLRSQIYPSRIDSAPNSILQLGTMLVFLVFSLATRRRSSSWNSATPNMMTYNVWFLGIQFTENRNLERQRTRFGTNTQFLTQELEITKATSEIGSFGHVEVSFLLSDISPGTNPDDPHRWEQRTRPGSLQENRLTMEEIQDPQTPSLSKHLVWWR